MKSLHWVILIIYSVLFLEILLELTSLKTLRGRFECWIKCQMGCQIECCIGCWIGFWIGVSEWVLIEGLCKRCLPIQNGAALCIWPMAGAAILPDEMRVLAFSQIWPFLVSESFSLGSWVLQLLPDISDESLADSFLALIILTYWPYQLYRGHCKWSRMFNLCMINNIKEAFILLRVFADLI